MSLNLAVVTYQTDKYINEVRHVHEISHYFAILGGNAAYVCIGSAGNRRRRQQQTDSPLPRAQLNFNTW